MQRDTIFFLITIALLVGSFGGFGYYHYQTTQGLRSDLAQASLRLERSVQDTRSDLQESVFVLDQKLDIKAQQLEQVDDQFHQRLIDQQKSITSVRTETQAGISQIQKTSEQLQEDLLTLNLQSKDFTIILDKIIDAVVAVRTNSGVGSGAIINSRGFIVTNKHVMAGATSAAVVTYYRKVHPVQLLAKSDKYDLALLKIGDADDRFTELDFEDDRNVRVGEKVAALGSPGGLDFTVTEGIVSALERETSDGVKFLQTDVSINPGNSGGPLINIQGKIVGINTMKKQDFEGIGFAIRGDQVEDFVQDAIQAYYAQQAQQQQ